jgi:hypothetical protein
VSLRWRQGGEARVKERAEEARGGGKSEEARVKEKAEEARGGGKGRRRE